MLKDRPGRQRTLMFIMIGAALMIAVEVFILPGEHSIFGRERPTQPPVVEVAVPAIDPVPDVSAQNLAPAQPDPSFPVMESLGPVVDDVILPEEEVTAAPPAWMGNAVTPPIVPQDKARIVVIIDDLGMNRKQSLAVLDLPGPVTAAFLPYADHVADMTAQAREKGHELIIHMPMEPMDGGLDTGNIALRADMDADAFDAMLEKGLNAFPGYVGMNNHMGSRLTQDRASMDRLMAKLAEKGLLFIDSRTIGNSVAEDAAIAHHVPHAGRDVFLDHDESYEGVVEALALTEKVAKRNGVAIAIGHPKENTVRALREWLPTLADKGFVLVPVSAVVAHDAPPQDAAEPVPVPVPDEQGQEVYYMPYPTFAEWWAQKEQ